MIRKVFLQDLIFAVFLIAFLFLFISLSSQVSNEKNNETGIKSVNTEIIWSQK